MASKKTTKKVVKKSATKAAKKVTKKTSTKKAATKRAPKKKTAQARVLVCANDDQCFWTTDGQVLKDMQELAAALESMADEVFTHHVTKEKNDFADWVEYVLQDFDCAQALRRSKKPGSARTVVIRHLKTYQL